ncbi:hypothetical protein EDC01DRAFT_635992 [Geopyxis carbonaria]|nr:hypothetical protein EDC01DRAFT_635992 [Geopyxis carbonaria]
MPQPSSCPYCLTSNCPLPPAIRTAAAAWREARSSPKVTPAEKASARNALTTILDNQERIRLGVWAAHAKRNQDHYCLALVLVCVAIVVISVHCASLAESRLGVIASLARIPSSLIPAFEVLGPWIKTRNIRKNKASEKGIERTPHLTGYELGLKITYIDAMMDFEDQRAMKGYDLEPYCMVFRKRKMI